ncbi:hypothetical protein KIN20_022136, partial [Parelaphostrongylus tenuis]
SLFCRSRFHLRERTSHQALLNRKRVVMQQVNARPHIIKKTKDKFDELDAVEVLQHSAYNPT